MSKKILGLDLGTNSIGWAYVKEGDTPEESKIEQIGVRVNPLTVDEQTSFEKGKPITTNAERTLKRGARRNLDRYQLRRENLIEILIKEGFITDKTILTENGKNTTFETWRLRAKAVSEKIEKEEFARVLLAINKKRGYKSSRKVRNEEEGHAVDGMAVAKKLYEENLTPGQYVCQLLNEGKKVIPDFYFSDLQDEFDKVWNFQKQYHPEILTADFYKELKGKGQRATSAMFWTKYNFNTADIKDLDDSLKTPETVKLNNRDKKKLQAYKWRSDAVSKKLGKEEMAYVLTEINNNLHSSSGYLGAISDRSKELYFNKLTVGEYLNQQLKENRHARLKNQVFYRQDYMDEFEAIWTEQAKHHSELTGELKAEIRDVVIFYQRKLKSQKGLISFCEFESREIEIDGKKKTIGLRVAPKSSPLFQEFKIWQNLSNVKLVNKQTGEIQEFKNDDTSEVKQSLFDELNLRGNLNASQILDFLKYDKREWTLSNFKALEGNRTNLALYDSFFKILEIEGFGEIDWENYKTLKADDESSKKTIFDYFSFTPKCEIILNETVKELSKYTASEIVTIVKKLFKSLNIDIKILDFDAELEGRNFEKQAAYQLWHLLYSAEDDTKKYSEEDILKFGNSDIGLKKNLCEKFGFKPGHAKILANVTFQDDYGSLSTKAMRKIIVHLKEGFSYGGQKDRPNEPSACEYAGYRHSKHSLTKEELENRVLKDRLDLLKKNSLRNPVVEKILNQMINVVNALIDKENDKLEKEGKPRNFHFDEIRIELARELKKNAKEREEMTNGINAAKLENDKIRDIIKKDFPNVKNPTKNDVVRYKLYQELVFNGYKDLYTNTKIDYSKLYSKGYDIDHIIPQSRLFDDSFSNKVLVPRQANLDKGNKTAYDYMSNKNEQDLENYSSNVENLYKEKKISKAKYKKLMMKESEIGEGFIERDLRETQYIAKKAKEILFQITKSVVSTSGQITDRLREDWDLINVMKEINLPKYRALGLTEMQERKFGQKVEVIKDWTKRNDHRHHAMDALTIAFTKHNHIQYLNNLNARKDEHQKLHSNIIAIENKETEIKIDDAGNKKRVFKTPISNFRQAAKEHIESIIISHKAKNKVTTKNKNKISGKDKPQVVATPRGQLHKETVYGKYHYYESKVEKIGTKFDKDTIAKVSNPQYRNLLLQRLAENKNDPKKAFGGKNALSKNPIYLNEEKTELLPEKVKLIWLTEDYSIRKDVTPENFKNEKLIEKVLDKKVKDILSARLKEFGNDPKKAFSDKEKNPIWFNKEQGISIKRVTISGVKNAEPLHYKKDHLGKAILNEGEKIPVDYVSTGNNHHVAVYRDEKGNLQENVISFFEAVERKNQGLPVIDKTFNQHLGWEFLFTMKQNELFVFPNEQAGFNPSEIDLLDPKNKALISSNLFRVQKYSFKNYVFRHHLETGVADFSSVLKGVTWADFRSSKGLDKIIKVRTNHLGDIVGVGEY